MGDYRYKVGDRVVLTRDDWKELPEGTPGVVTAIYYEDALKFPVRVKWDYMASDDKRAVIEAILPDGYLMLESEIELGE